MLFDEKRNRIIKLMLEMDEEFQKEFKKFIEILPKKIIEKCQKCRSFEMETDTVSCELGIFRDEENMAELDVYADNLNSYLLAVCQLKEKSLNKLEIYFENETCNPYYEIGAFTITNENEVEYRFEVRRKSDKEYSIVMMKDTNDMVEKTIEKNFSYEELIEALQTKSTKR